MLPRGLLLPGQADQLVYIFCDSWNDVRQEEKMVD